MNRPKSSSGPLPPLPGEHLQSGIRARVALLVCPDGLWFRSPDGPVVSIERWRPLQRLLLRLVEEREVRPGMPLTVEALVEAGWPSERMIARAGATRVYTAIASLRRLGLRDVLVRIGGGYLLVPAIPLERVREG
jgi:hypothetical protein